MAAKKVMRSEKDEAPTSKKGRRGTAKTAFLINVFAPGFGTLIGGKIFSGSLQFGVLFIGGLVAGVVGATIVPTSKITGVILIFLGVLMIVLSWIWALISSVVILKSSE